MMFHLTAPRKLRCTLRGIHEMCFKRSQESLPSNIRSLVALTVSASPYLLQYKAHRRSHQKESRRLEKLQLYHQ